jgi:predicted alpha/beta superfamily hydrolase
MPRKRWSKTAVLTFAALAGLLLACSRQPTNPNRNSWRLLPGHVEPLSFAAFRQGRHCWVYLPPGYTMSDARYPVLYVNDGTSVFEPGIHANRICEDLIRAGEITPLIVVAISVPDSERFWDYAPWPDDFFFSGKGGGGDLYIRAIRDTLKPEVDRRFRTLRDPAHTAIAGYSLGGLISAYAGFAYDSTFGMVGASSPSYWWRSDEIIRFAAHRGRRPFLTRYYQDTGYPRDNYTGNMEDLLLQQRYVNGLDFLSVTVKDATHSVPAWEHRFPDMLKFLFKP